MVMMAVFGIPLIGAVLVTLAVRVRFEETKAFWMFVAGAVLAVGFVAAVYLNAPPNYASSNGVDGEMYLGRWWDPTLTSFLAGVGLAGWCLGVAVGLALRGGSDALRPRK